MVRYLLTTNACLAVVWRFLASSAVVINLHTVPTYVGRVAVIVRIFGGVIVRTTHVRRTYINYIANNVLARPDTKR